jgi:hypothetical protein
MPTANVSAAGDLIPPNCEIIEVRVVEIGQLFNTIDPTPFRDRDLDPNVEEFIVDWSREISMTKSIALVVHLDRAASTANEAVIVRDSIHRFFGHRAAATRGRLRRLFHRGRVSLVIGLAVLTAMLFLAQFISHHVDENGLAPILHESLLIGGWVAMWRPLEIFLYDWWPIRTEARLYDRLTAAPVRLDYTRAGSA